MAEQSRWATVATAQWTAGWRCDRDEQRCRRWATAGVTIGDGDCGDMILMGYRRRCPHRLRLRHRHRSRHHRRHHDCTAVLPAMARLLMHRRPSTRRLVVTSGWLSSLHLSSRHCLNVPADCHVASRCATLSFAPAGCRVMPPPPPLNAPSQCRLATHRATLSFIPPGYRVTPRRNTASQHVGWLYIASHCATLTFDPAGCCVTSRRHNRHSSRSRSHLAVHVTADENAQALSQLRGPSTLRTLAKSLKSPPRRLPEK